MVPAEKLPPIPKMNADEKAALESLEAKAIHIRTSVRQVVKGFATGLFLWGEGGTGKSYNVLEELRQLKSHYILHNSRLTARGLVDSLEEFPHHIHFIEDAETLFADKNAAGVLRSALWSQSKAQPMARPITWKAHKTHIEFVFTGGIIVISNANLAESAPEIRAIKTRISVLKLDMLPNEIQALMKKMCRDGFSLGDYYAAPDECWQVACHIAERLETMKRPLDLRLMLNGFRDFLFHRSGDSPLDWRDLLESKMVEQVGAQIYKGRKVEKRGQTELAKMLLSDKTLTRLQRLEKWKAETGLAEKTLYAAAKR